MLAWSIGHRYHRAEVGAVRARGAQGFYLAPDDQYSDRCPGPPRRRSSLAAGRLRVGDTHRAPDAPDAYSCSAHRGESVRRLRAGTAGAGARRPPRSHARGCARTARAHNAPTRAYTHISWRILLTV